MTALLSKLQLLARDIKLSHSIFALPFALLGMFLAAGWAFRFPYWGEGVLIVVCMVLARTYAMAVNRWADRKLDVHNPRTVGRAIPSGKLGAGFVFGIIVLCAIAFIVAAAGFVYYMNPWPLVLSPFVLAWLAFYSYAKRFTSWCHVILGIALAISPLAAAIAVEPGYLQQPAIYLLVVMVACWVAGFDIIYALQDVEVDRALGLHSMPSRMGTSRALWVSRLLHVIALTSLVALVIVERQLGFFFAIGVMITACLLLVEHALVWGSKTGQINMAFFTVNGIISLLLGVLGVMDIWRAM